MLRVVVGGSGAATNSQRRRIIFKSKGATRNVGTGGAQFANCFGAFTIRLSCDKNVGDAKCEAMLLK